MEKIKEQLIATAEEATGADAEKKQTDAIGTLLREILMNAGKFETKNEEEFSAKDVAVDRLLDAQTAIHEEKRSNNPADLYAAYAALNEAQKYCSKINDFGIEKALIALRRQMKEKYDLTPENMKTGEKEIAARQEKISSEINGFYEKSAQETENNLTEFFDKTAAASPDKEKTGNLLLKYLEKGGKTSKILCAVTLSLAMGGIFSEKESEAKTGDKIPQTAVEAAENDTTIALEKTKKEIEEKMNTAAEKTTETAKIVKEKIKTAAEETTETMELAKEKMTKLQKSVKKNMKELGLFAKIGLIKGLKKYSAEILEVLKTDDYENATAQKLLNNTGDENLKTIIDIYLHGLQEIKEIDTNVYKEATKKLETLVRDTLDLSLGELRAKYLS